MTKARVYTLGDRHAQAVLLGNARIINLPSDASVVNYHANLKRGGLDVKIHSSTFADIPEGRALPEVPAQVEILNQ